MTTIRMVAKLAGVSTGTVSNVLSRNRPVSEEVRRRVLQAIEELGYQPNLIAHSLVTGRSMTIGAVVPEFSIRELITGIDDETKKIGYSLLVSSLKPGENPLQLLYKLSAWQVDGIIWAIPETDDSHKWIDETKLRLKVPIVLALCTPRPLFSSVWIDNFSGGYEATRHLIEHGSRKNAHITGPMNHQESKDRKSGWEKALSDAGIEPKMVVEGGWSIKDGWLGMQKLIDHWPDIEAVFVASDDPAIGAMNYLQRSGRRVPDDVKVIGYDDVMELDYYNPPLTSIHQDYSSLWTCVVQELCRRIQDPNAEPKAQTLSTHLVVRNSCGCHYPEKRDINR